MSDIRLMFSYRGHHKIKKLRLKLGEAGPMAHIYLLLFAGESKSDGVLEGMDAEDIALAADYRGDAHEFVETLQALKLLDLQGETYSIHNWAKHNPYAAGAEERSEHGRKAAKARWKKEKGLTLGRSTKKQQLTHKNDAPSINEQYNEHDSAMRGAQKSNAPVPIPYPPPVPNSDQTLSINPKAVEVTNRAHEAAADEFDYSNWYPDETCLNRIRASDRDVTDSFIERERLEFITIAEDSKIQPRWLRARFQSQVHQHWIRAKARETNTGPLQTAPSMDLQKVPTDQLDAWSKIRGGPASYPGESPDEYRARIDKHLKNVKNRESDESTSIFQSAAESLTIN